MSDKKDEMKKETYTPLIIEPYNGRNGITIICLMCGCESEETSGGYYKPIAYEADKYNRMCIGCLNQEGLLPI